MFTARNYTQSYGWRSGGSGRKKRPSVPESFSARGPERKPPPAEIRQVEQGPPAHDIAAPVTDSFLIYSDEEQMRDKGEGQEDEGMEVESQSVGAFEGDKEGHEECEDDEGWRQLRPSKNPKLYQKAEEHDYIRRDLMVVNDADVEEKVKATVNEALDSQMGSIFEGRFAKHNALKKAFRLERSRNTEWGSRWGWEDLPCPDASRRPEGLLEGTFDSPPNSRAACSCIR